MRKFRFFSGLLLTVMGMGWGLPLLNVQAASTVSVSVKDTVAGSPTVLQTSILPSSDISSGVFFVRQPSGTMVRVSAQKNSVYQNLRGELYGQQTRQAGLYTATVLLSGGITSSPVAFRVYPGQASLTQSKLKSLHPMLEAGERGNISVELLDAYGNPVPSNAVQLFSSRAGDTVRPVNEGQPGDSGEPANTDKNGRAYFEIISPYPGVSTLTALHLGKPLEQRLEMVFSEPSLSFKDGIGGNFLSANLLGGNLLEGNQQQVMAGPVAKLMISDLPSTVVAGTDQTLTITAQDANGNTAVNYTGKVLIGATGDDNATFPNEYQFTEADQGRHSFPLGFRFNTLGKVTVQVFDANNFQLGGEKVITVTSANAMPSGPGGQTPIPTGSQPTIKSPTDGTRVGSTAVTVNGSADTFKNMQLYVDGVKTQSLSSDDQGFFTATVNNLSDGPHEFYVMVEELGGGGQVSAKVTVNVDTKPPVLQNILLSPDLASYEPGQAITAVIYSEPNLDTASLSVQGLVYPLTPGVDPGSYSTTFAAPQAGQYFIKVSLTDALFNKAQYDADTFVVQGQPSTPPPKIQGVQGQGGDGSITLVWNALTGSTSPIQKYTLQYGTAFDNLTESMEVTPDQTTATISNLQNGTTYYAKVVATDTKGVSSEPSITLAITPKPAQAEPVAPPTPILSQPVVVQPTLTASGAENGVILQWALGTAQQNLDPVGYMVYFGLEPGQYTDSYYAQGKVKSVLVPDLISGVSYYFTVVPLSAMGQELGRFFPEVKAVPGVSTGLGANLLPAASSGPNSPNFLNNDTLSIIDQNTQSGPEALWIVVLSLLASPLFYFYRRRAVR